MTESIAPAAQTPRVYLRIDRLTKKFGAFVALDRVSLEVFEGEFICFLGPSGCGKTTFLRAIAGLDIQTSGSVEQDGLDISALPPAERDFGIVFQSYALFPNLTSERNIAFGLENQKLGKAKITARVAELLELVGLPEQGDKYPAQLSGGQQQRIALARALATSPGLLLLDEPLSALDAKVRGHLRHEMKLLQRRLGVTTVMVTHDQEEALTMADRIVVMNQGVIEQVGTPTEIYREPDTLFVADFIGEMNQVKGRVESETSVSIGDIRLASRPHKLAQGASAVVAIRPEDIIPHGAGARSAGTTETMADTGNTLDMQIENMEFLGSFWRVSLWHPGFGDDRLRADMSINAMRRLSIEEGSSIQVELPADRLWVFASESR
ncbi:MAG: putative 2-aminoethylphosphonate ABC transporter ATP-binding protein [Gammaproteobacteria bacterium]|jgi:iron(III) transport system ATP-binding protein|nr:putative 2-aminoethylphosphonate ABC transporter ATP-binding protein [Gammaproteobacteria bacterium]